MSLHVYKCLHVHLCMHKHVYLQMYVCVQGWEVSMHMWVYLCINRYMCGSIIYICLQIHICIYECMFICMLECMCLCVWVWVLACVCLCVNKCGVCMGVYVYISMQGDMSKFLCFVFVCICRSVHSIIIIYMCMRVFVCMSMHV